MFIQRLAVSATALLLAVAQAYPAHAAEPVIGTELVVAGLQHSCARVQSRAVCWGVNDDGQLGNGTLTPSAAAVDVIGLPGPVTGFALGRRHTCAVSDGAAWCWGYNGTGQLGDGTKRSATVPVRVVGLSTGVTAVAAGAGHSCAVLSTGAVKCWGDNGSGQLGDGSATASTTPVDVAISGAAAVAAGGSFTCALATSGTVKCWGDGHYGQLGNGPTFASSVPVDVLGLSGATSLSAGFEFACATTGAGAVRCWGRNFSGQLGDGGRADARTPVEVVGLTNAVSVSAGAVHSCALTASGGAKCWGSNNVAQLGIGVIGAGITTYVLTPVDVVGATSGVVALSAGGGIGCAVFAPVGTLRCWGANRSGEVGTGAFPYPTGAVQVLSPPSNVTALAAGGDSSCEFVGNVPVPGLLLCRPDAAAHTCAIDGQGGVWCWGSNANGQLGNGSAERALAPTPVPGLTEGVVALALGANHSCALTSAGGVKCWGDNQSGQLGNGTVAASLVPLDVTGLAAGVMTIAAGPHHTCAVTSAGAAKCWGANHRGQVGIGSTAEALTPQDVVGLASGVAGIAAGGESDTGLRRGFTCAWTLTGAAKCWGANNKGQLGNPIASWATSPVDVTGLNADVVALTAGGAHACARSAGGEVRCWGSTSHYEAPGLDSGFTTPVTVPALGATSRIDAGALNTCAVTPSGSVRCWGIGYLAQPPTETIHDIAGLPLPASSLTLGSAHGCAIVPTGRAMCWGRDNDGQLGDGGALYYPLHAQVVAASSCAGMRDVSSQSPFCHNVLWLANRTITRGCAEGTYCPDAPVSRLAMAAFAQRLAGSLTPAGYASSLSLTALDAQFVPIVCVISSVVPGAQRRSVRGDAVVSLRSQTDATFLLELIGFTQFSGPPLPAASATPASLSGGRWTQVRLIGAFDTGTGPDSFNVGVRVRPADATSLSTIDEMTCNVRVIADNADELRMQAP